MLSQETSGRGELLKSGFDFGRIPAKIDIVIMRHAYPALRLIEPGLRNRNHPKPEQIESSEMQVPVELFGIPRQRAGVARTTAEGCCLGDVLADLAERFPSLGTACIDGRHLRSGFTANLGGDRFVTDPETILHDGDAVLILSVDAGG